MAKKQKKQEALSVSRLINEVLVAQLSIPFRQIVNDTTFSKYTGSKRPDILISEFEYDGTNDEQYIKNLVAYAEAKDDCKVEDKDWKDALKQGKIKAPKLGLPYFIVTNCKTTYFYNAKTLKQLTLNGNPIREFQTIDIYRLIKNKLTANPDLDSINTNVDSISTISEAIFNKKLWELAGVYRGINFIESSHTKFRYLCFCKPALYFSPFCSVNSFIKILSADASCNCDISFCTQLIIELFYNLICIRFRYIQFFCNLIGSDKRLFCHKKHLLYNYFGYLLSDTF